MSKLISEADKLLEKGKIPEAIGKLKLALSAEPLNQLVATKLANVMVDQGDSPGAAKVYVALASRLSEAGKAQVAIAIYKQALELNPTDIELKVKFAIECEAVGKLSDAQIQANLALQYFLRRKKYFDATNVLPLLARVQTKDEKIKIAWVEIMQLSQAEQKLVHLLVALCGPPGLVSQEFPTGGDPINLSEPLFESLKRLVPFFPRDPKIAYAVAWAAHRRGKDKDFYHYLRECIRREPDFCLALLLLSRVFAEKQKLNESLFVYKYLKERLSSDKSADMLTISRLMESFVEKNGWITFTEGMGVEDLDAAAFLKAISGETAPAPVAAPAGVGQAASLSIPTPNIPSRSVPSAPPPQSAGNSLSPEVPAEIEISLGSEEEGLELQLSNAPAKAAPSVPGNSLAAAPVAPPSPVASPRAVAKAPVPETPLVENADSVEFTSIIKMNVEEKAELAALSLGVNEELPPSSEPVAIVAAESPAVAEMAEPIEEVKPKNKVTFNPLAAMEDSSNEIKSTSQQEMEERTQMFSPMDLLGASNRVPLESQKVDTKLILKKAEDLADFDKVILPPHSPPALPTSSSDVRSLSAEGTETKEFSPFESIQAEKESRKSHVAMEAESTRVIDVAEMPSGMDELSLEESANNLADSILAGNESGLDLPVMDDVDPLELLANAEGEATKFVTRPEPMEKMVFEPVAPVLESQPDEGEEERNLNPVEISSAGGGSSEEMGTMVFQVSQNLPGEELAPGIFSPQAGMITPFSKIPEAAPSLQDSSDSSSGEETVDLGDDLLEGPTRGLVMPAADSTAHLFKEIKNDLKEKKSESISDLDYMLKKAERYIAKRNYYLARKALRHSLALGADEAMIKERLRDIRKLEMPESFYGAMSSDDSGKEQSEEILDRLEDEFELHEVGDQSSEDEVTASLDVQLDVIFRENDARTILDFGVALHEMGLFRQAEAVYARLIQESPEISFDAYYLAAVAKRSRKDYAGAASILKKLSGEIGKTEQQKIQIYYALGELFEKMRRPERSKEFFKKVAELDSNYRNIRHKLED